jgi:hypothetical protein
VLVPSGDLLSDRSEQAMGGTLTALLHVGTTIGLFTITGR